MSTGVKVEDLAISYFTSDVTQDATKTQYGGLSFGVSGSNETIYFTQPVQVDIPVTATEGEVIAIYVKHA